MNRATSQLRRGIQLGLLVLLALMPFHAFLSVWLGSLIGHQAVIQAWKEVLLVALGLAGLWLLYLDPATRARLDNWPVRLSAAWVGPALLVTLIALPPAKAVAFGLKTDLEFLVPFGLALLVATPRWIRAVTAAVLIPAAVVSTFALLQAYVLPLDFLTHFGYGPATILPYQWVSADYAVPRFGATLGGPNQLGTYLLLPLALAVVLAWRRRRWGWLALVVIGVPGLWHTYSRAAWLGALAASVVLVMALTAPHRRRIVALALAAIALLGAAASAILIRSQTWFRHLIQHGAQAGSSDALHLQSLAQGTGLALAAPLGHGLGTAGPAAFHTHQGLVIENYYLQLAYETGLTGMVIFVVFLAATTRALATRATHHDLALASLAALVGVSLSALFLPAWTDSTTALTVWTATGASLGLGAHHRHD